MYQVIVLDEIDSMVAYTENNDKDKALLYVKMEVIKVLASLAMRELNEGRNGAVRISSQILGLAKFGILAFAKSLNLKVQINEIR